MAIAVRYLGDVIQPFPATLFAGQGLPHYANSGIVRRMFPVNFGIPVPLDKQNDQIRETALAEADLLHLRLCSAYKLAREICPPAGPKALLSKDGFLASCQNNVQVTRTPLERFIADHVNIHDISSVVERIKGKGAIMGWKKDGQK